jgi:hypothetical protein
MREVKYQKYLPEMPVDSAGGEIFAAYGEWYRINVGVDPYAADAKQRANLESTLYAIQYIRDRRLVNDETLERLWDEYYRRERGELPDDEQRAKNTANLAKARAVRHGDEARFGFCKRRGCACRKERRLLVRGFCPTCRGIVAIKQTVAETGSRITVERDEARPETNKPTRAEKQRWVLGWKAKYPSMSTREIGYILGIEQSTVARILQRRRLMHFCTPVNPLMQSDAFVQRHG